MDPAIAEPPFDTPAAPAAPVDVDFSIDPAGGQLDAVPDAAPTDDDAESLVSEHGREKLKKQLLLSIKKKTDVKVEEVLFTDVAVQ